MINSSFRHLLALSVFILVSVSAIHLPIQQPVSTTTLTIRMLAPVGDSSAFGSVTELAGGQANAMDQVENSKSKTDLNIIEAEFHTAP